MAKGLMDNRRFEIGENLESAIKWAAFWLALGIAIAFG